MFPNEHQWQTLFSARNIHIKHIRRVDFISEKMNKYYFSQFAFAPSRRCRCRRFGSFIKIIKTNTFILQSGQQNTHNTHIVYVWRLGSIHVEVCSDFLTRAAQSPGCWRWVLTPFFNAYTYTLSILCVSIYGTYITPNVRPVGRAGLLNVVIYFVKKKNVILHKCAWYAQADY